MKFVDRTKLQCELVAHGLTIKDLGDELCLTYTGVYNKVKGFREFKENEIFVLYSLFGDSIFFLDTAGSGLRTTNNGRSKKKNKSS